jgi:hypothetical protein
LTDGLWLALRRGQRVDVLQRTADGWFGVATHIGTDLHSELAAVAVKSKHGGTRVAAGRLLPFLGARQRVLRLCCSSQNLSELNCSWLLPPQPKNPHDSATLGFGKSGLKSPARWRVRSFLISALLASVQ